MGPCALPAPSALSGLQPLISGGPWRCLGCCQTPACTFNGSRGRSSERQGGVSQRRALEVSGLLPKACQHSHCEGGGERGREGQQLDGHAGWNGATAGSIKGLVRCTPAPQQVSNVLKYSIEITTPLPQMPPLQQQQQQLSGSGSSRQAASSDSQAASRR